MKLQCLGLLRNLGVLDEIVAKEQAVPMLRGLTPDPVDVAIRRFVASWSMTSTRMSTIGFAASPGIAALPKCSMRRINPTGSCAVLPIKPD